MSNYKAPKEAVEEPYRLLPAVLDHVAKVTPDRVFASVPISANLDDGLRDVTFDELRRAIDSLATWLMSTLGRSQTYETLTYMGVDDLRYAIFFYACVKAGYKAFFTSPGNTVRQNANLTRQAECKHVFHSSEFETLVQKIAADNVELTIHLLEPLNYWLAAYGDAFPYRRTYEEAKFDPMLVLHSSGSTGNPKVIVVTHQYFVNVQKIYPPVDGRPAVGIAPYNLEGGGYMMGTVPFCHMGGILTCAIYPMYSKSLATLLGPPGKRITAELAISLMKMRQVRTFCGGPATIEDLVKRPDGLELARKLDWLTFIGGPLAESCGNILSKDVKICNTYGATEIGGVVLLEPKPDSWDWMEFHPAAKVSMEEEVEGQYELVLYQDHEADYWRPAAGTVLRDDPMFRTKDLFVPHPEKPNLWKFNGRKDDIIIFSTGTKWTPIPSEGHILSASRADGVLIAGAGRKKPALLIEMSVGEQGETSALDRIWPIVEETNQRNGEALWIERNKIALVKPGTFLRTPKGTVVRKLTLELLTPVLDTLYGAASV